MGEALDRLRRTRGDDRQQFVALAGTEHVSGYTRKSSTGKTVRVGAYTRSPGTMSKSELQAELKALGDKDVEKGLSAQEQNRWTQIATEVRKRVRDGSWDAPESAAEDAPPKAAGPGKLWGLTFDSQEEAQARLAKVQKLKGSMIVPRDIDTFSVQQTDEGWVLAKKKPLRDLSPSQVILETVAKHRQEKSSAAKEPDTLDRLLGESRKKNLERVHAEISDASAARKRQLAARGTQLQADAYKELDIRGFSGPDDPNREKVIDWIAARLKKSEVTQQMIDALEDQNAHAAATAAERVLKKTGPGQSDEAKKKQAAKQAVHKPVADAIAQIAEASKGKRGATISDVAYILGISTASAKARIAAAVQAGAIERRGTGTKNLFPA